MMNNSEMIALKAFFDKATPEQMHEMALYFNQASKAKAAQAAASFKVGDKVVWTGRNGPMMGTVKKVMQKNVIVGVGAHGGGDQWRVTASMLKAA